MQLVHQRGAEIHAGKDRVSWALVGFDIHCYTVGCTKQVHTGLEIWDSQPTE